MSASLLLALWALRGEAPTRADLAVSYLRFEHALRDRPPAEALRVEIERGFDGATLAFFTGDGARALSQIDDLSARLDPNRAESVAERLADALALDFEPRQIVSSTGGNLSLRLRPLRAVAADALGDRKVTVRVVMPTSTGRRTLAARELPVPHATTVEGPLVLAIPGGGDFPAARIDLELELEVAGARPRRVGSVALVGKPLEVLRRDVESRLARIDADGPPLEQALAACRARAALLDPSPSTKDSARFLLDLAAHAADVELEVAELELGRDPYRRRPGELWRVVRTGDGVDLPVRVFAPEAACGETRVPLVVALHGAGGDENMFLTAYGIGRLRDLAREHGFVAVCPRVGFGGLSPEAFDAIVRAMVYTYPIDPKRIHVVGHSMGAGAAGALRLARADRIASTALLAGAPRLGGDAKSPPLYLVGGELDPLANAAGLRRAGESVAAEGAEVEMRILAGRGHTLFVGDVLPDAIAWCLARRKP
ncbi:MAG: alpha/beta fold hydrolase [Planctomycetota bacterium]|nr:alpha/beta fold hydrolase [Planctomycetota bacterium]